jgi:hypothetical protein
LCGAKRERASTDIDRAQLLDGLAQRTGGSEAARNDVVQRLIGCKCEGFCRDFDHFSDKLSANVLHRKRRRRRKIVVLEVARSLTDFGILVEEPEVLTQRTVVFNGHSSMILQQLLGVLQIWTSIISTTSFQQRFCIEKEDEA